MLNKVIGAFSFVSLVACIFCFIFCLRLFFKCFASIIDVFQEKMKMYQIAENIRGMVKGLQNIWEKCSVYLLPGNENHIFEMQCTDQ